jgi:hypothetical protein
MAHVPRVTNGVGEPNVEADAPRRVLPNAPAGSGGPGHFRDADNFRADEEPDETVRHAKTPAVRMLAADAVSQPTSGGTTATRQPAPRTTPLSQKLVSQSGPEFLIDVQLLVVEDKMNDKTVKKPLSAETRCMPSSGLEHVSAPIWNIDANGKVTGLKRKLVVNGSYTIRTSYRPGSDPSDDSKYGRGTTAADKASGNVTLGFHESCHRDDYIGYLTKTPFPKFRGKIGMTADDFSAAVDEFTAAFEAFGAGYQALGAAVDEVGDCKQSDWEAGNCP